LSTTLFTGMTDISLHVAMTSEFSVTCYLQISTYNIPILLAIRDLTSECHLALLTIGR
jgi:hypothetical protein